MAAEQMPSIDINKNRAVWFVVTFKPVVLIPLCLFAATSVPTWQAGQIRLAPKKGPKT